MNHFELFQIPISLQPDKQKLKATFYELSRKYHPDFYTRENEFDQADVLEKSAQVNKAFKLLSNADETIKYVLIIKNLLREDEKYNLPQAFLMEVMEINEALLDAQLTNDALQKQQVALQVAALQQDILEPVKSIIEGYAESVTTDAELLMVKDYYFKKKYLDRILEGMR